MTPELHVLIARAKPHFTYRGLSEATGIPKSTLSDWALRDPEKANYVYRPVDESYLKSLQSVMDEAGLTLEGKQTAMSIIMDDWKTGGPRAVKGEFKRGRAEFFSNPHLLCVNPADLHIGKRAYAEDVTVADTIDLALSKFEEILEMSSPYNLEEILIWYGNDLIQADTLRGETTRGTPVEVSTSWYNQFDAGVSLGVAMIYLALHYTDKVTIRYIPGNHPWHSEYGIVDSIGSRFHGDERVEVYKSRSGRDVHVYGETLLIGAHGNNSKHVNAVRAVAFEHPKEWGATTYREIHTGHLHYVESGEIFVNNMEEGGVIWRQSPSLSNTDGWHKTKTYVGSTKALEGYLYDKYCGYRTTFHARA